MSTTNPPDAPSAPPRRSARTIVLAVIVGGALVVAFVLAGSHKTSEPTVATAQNVQLSSPTGPTQAQVQAAAAKQAPKPTPFRYFSGPQDTENASDGQPPTRAYGTVQLPGDNQINVTIYGLPQSGVTPTYVLQALDCRGHRLPLTQDSADGDGTFQYAGTLPGPGFAKLRLVNSDPSSLQSGQPLVPATATIGRCRS